MTNNKSNVLCATSRASLILCLVVFSLMASSCTRSHPVPRGTKSPCSSLAGYGFPMMVSPPPEADFICHEGYALNFNSKSNTSLWVVEHLTGDRLGQKGYPYLKNYRPDPDVPSPPGPDASDYNYVGFDFGNLAPPEDFVGDEDQVKESFFLSNVVPQNSMMRRGIWFNLEKKVRGWAMDQGELYVVTGPIYAGDQPIQWMGSHHVAIPTHLFKVVLSPRKKEAFGFIIPNRPVYPSTATIFDLTAFAVPVSEVERVTGLVFFTSLKAGDSQNLKRQLPPAWAH